MAKSKKQSHTQRLVDSMKTLGTARTPITAAYETGADRNILPKDVRGNGSKGTKTTHNRVLIPQKVTEVAEPALDNKTYPSYDDVRGWDTRHGAYGVDISTYNTRVADRKSYLNALKKRNTALDSAELNRLSKLPGGTKRVASILKGSRGGYGRHGGLKGGSRS